MSGLWGYFKKSKDQSSTLSIGPSKKAEPGPFKYFILLTGKTLNSHNALMDRLKRQVPDLQEVQTEAECDIILVFCPVVRGPEHDMKAALEELNEISGTKPAVLVVLHHTFDPDSVVSDSSRAVSRENTLTVDCLFHEDQGLLQCRKNEESIGRIVTHIKPQIQRIKSVWERREIDQYCVTAEETPQAQGEHANSMRTETGIEPGQQSNPAPRGARRQSFPSSNKHEQANQEQMKSNYPGQAENPTLKYFILLTGQTLNTHDIFMSRLKHEIPQLQQVSTVDECDVILAFCPVVSRPGTDIEAAVKKLNRESADKPTVLVVLHHTFNPECVVPNSSRAVHRGNTITVDCLFYENQGLLQCRKNQESFTRVRNYIKPQICPKKFPENKRKAPIQPGSYSSNEEAIKREQMKRRHSEQAENPTLKYFILLTGQTLNTHDIFMSRLKHEIPQLQQVSTVDECDVILAFCPVVSRAGTDIEAGVKKLNRESAVKPAVLVVLHRTFDPECVVPHSSRAVHRENTITVDCLFCEDQGLLRCRKNQESFTRVRNYIKPQIQPVQSKEENVETQETPVLAAKKPCKYFVLKSGNTPASFIDKLEKMSDLQEVTSEDPCDFILTLCRGVSRDVTDFQREPKKPESTSENDYKLKKQSNKKDVLLVTSANQAKPDVENVEPMETQEEGGASQCGDKLENMTSENTLETQLQEKDKQLEEMRTELKKLKTELAEKNEELKNKEGQLDDRACAGQRERQTFEGNNSGGEETEGGQS